MDENNNIPENTNAEIPSSPPVTTNTESLQTQPEQHKRRFWQSPKFIFTMILLLILTGIIIYMVYVFNVYRTAEVYKKSHDIAVKELRYCDSVEGTTQSREVFDYCDRLKEQFREVAR